MDSVDTILVSVNEIADDAPILLKWKHINGFTLYVATAQRGKITPFSTVECNSLDDMEKSWSYLSESERKDYCKRAKELRGNSSLNRLVYQTQIVQQQKPHDVARLYSYEMMLRDVCVLL